MGRFALGVLAVVSLVITIFALFVPPTDPAPPTQLSDGVVVDGDAVYDPFRAGEEFPDGYRQVLGRDVIAPVYEPQFVAAAESGWEDEVLVIGVEIDGDARAYPVGFLNRREMVIDSIAGIPVLVTW